MAPASPLRLAAVDDADEHFFKAGYTDGFPVVLPTRKRVTHMLRGTALDAQDVIGKCPPSYAEVTVEKLAIAAVMAGCTAEMFRIVLAATKAALKPEFGLHGVNATTMGATPVLIVNGPCRHVAKVNFEHGVCGSGTRSHCIGRALKLLLQNVGRAKLAGTESTTIGTPMKFGLCFAEWEEHAGFWEPLAVETGAAKRDEDAVTVVSCTSGPVQLVDTDSTAEELVQRLGRILSSAWAPQTPLINNVLLVISPEHYNKLLKGGFDSKKKLAQELWKQSSMHVVPFLPQIVLQVLKMKKPSWPWFLCKGISMLASLVAAVLQFLRRPLLSVPKFSSPGSFNIAVAGASAGKFSCFMPGFGAGVPGMPTANMSQPVTMRVEPRPTALDRTPAKEEGTESDILDPTSEIATPLLQLAHRTGRLEGPVALMDISKARGKELLDVFEAKLRSDGLETKRYSKPTFSRPCPEELRKRITTECKSVMLGLAD